MELGGGGGSARRTTKKWMHREQEPAQLPHRDPGASTTTTTLMMTMVTMACPVVHCTTRKLPPTPPPPLLSSNKKSADDCGVSMTCRCRKVSILYLFLSLAVLFFYCNFSLVVKLGAANDSAEYSRASMMSSTVPQQKHRFHLGPSGGGDDEVSAAVVLRDASNLVDPQQLLVHKMKQQLVVSADRSRRMGDDAAQSKDDDNNSSRDGKKVSPRTTLAPPSSLARNASFSACLLIKDDNEILPEWIAYHYHTIHLRHLVVAVDPTSSESPASILHNWRRYANMTIQEWDDTAFMPAAFLETGLAPDRYMAAESDFKTKQLSEETIAEISNHRYRQRVFLAKCMRSLREQGSSWVIHIVRVCGLAYFSQRRIPYLKKFQ
jgi:hypothetical protein